MPDEPQPAIELHDVVHRYPHALAVDSVSLAIEAGASTAIVGPDGVGKSTLLGLIAGVRRMQSGELKVLGGNMKSARHRDRISHRTAYMPQGLGRNLYPSLSVLENLDFFGRLFGLDKQNRHVRIDRLLAATGLDPFAERPAGKLSGGMKQKLSLCSALIHEPDILILDEPTTGIDPLSRRQFWTLIDQIKADRTGMTVLVSTAYMEEAERFARIVAMDAGRILIDGSKDEILAKADAENIESAFLTLRGSKRKPFHRDYSAEVRSIADGAPVIEADGLTRRFGDFVAVDNVSFSIRTGEIFGFLGSNGCGKTTTMKMLTGLLAASEGSANLLGKPVQAKDIEARHHIGYMSQSFSLYEELSVRANLDLHARLYQIPNGVCETRIAEVLERFDIAQVAGEKPKSLPLGVRQRLQLATACLHRPEVLILDEPTSGVDPEARDMFWEILFDLSRNEGVTIFISTHFMNEAERCDRISLMHAGKVLAVGTPESIVSDMGTQTLEDAFVAHLEHAQANTTKAAIRAPPKQSLIKQATSGSRQPRDPIVFAASMGRIWAFARREFVEIARDRVRIAFALLGPLVLILTLGYGLTFDVEKLTFAAFDRDRTAESRLLIQEFSSSRYFNEHAPIYKPKDIDRRLKSGELRLVINVPPRYGKDLLQGRRPEVAFFLDGANAFRAETARGYLQGTMATYIALLAQDEPGRVRQTPTHRIEPRFRYNQDFRSTFAMVPGSIMMIMALIPAMMAALGVVREREIGSISNLYASPATVAEFIIGKQLPYVFLSYVSFLSLIAVALLQFSLTIKGSIAALLLAGLLYVFATTALGLLISSFVRTQIAALIGTAVICVVPTIQFSGYLYPAATLEGSAYYMGHGFPALWFQNVSLGTFAKGQGFTTFFAEFTILFSFGVAFLVAAQFLLSKQER